MTAKALKDEGFTNAGVDPVLSSGTIKYYGTFKSVIQDWKRNFIFVLCCAAIGVFSNKIMNVGLMFAGPLADPNEQGRRTAFGQRRV